jgi:hypothetical protein
MEIGRRGTARARSRRVLAARELLHLTAVRFHSYAAGHCAGLASSHATSAIDVTSDHPLMMPSHGAQDHARGSER